MTLKNTTNIPVAGWLVKHLDFKTSVTIITLIAQSAFFYAKIVDRMNDMDSRLTKVEQNYLPRQEAEIKAQLREEQFKSIQHALDRQEDGIAELRRLMEVPMRVVLPLHTAATP